MLTIILNFLGKRDPYARPLASGLVAPDAGLNSSSIPRTSYTILVSGRTELVRDENSHSDGWDRSATFPMRSGQSYRDRYVRPPLNLREDVEMDSTTTEGPSGEICTSFLYSTMNRHLRNNADPQTHGWSPNEVDYPDRTGRPRKQSVASGEHNLHRQITPTVSTEAWRPQSSSRTPTPSGYRDYTQSPSAYTHRRPHSPLHRSAVRPDPGSPLDRP